MLASSLPREKLHQFGAPSLTEIELWQCVLGWGRPGHSVQSLARGIHQALKSWSVFDRRLPPLSAELGQAQQARVSAVLELAYRWNKVAKSTLDSPEAVLAWCQELRRAATERLLVLYCGINGEVLRQETVAVGGLNSATLSPRDIFRPVADLPVDSLVLCHNHPGGSLQPSAQDEVFTARVEAACKLLGFWLRDHLIVTTGEYFSFREAGRLQDRL